LFYSYNYFQEEVNRHQGLEGLVLIIFANPFPKPAIILFTSVRRNSAETCTTADGIEPLYGWLNRQHYTSYRAHRISTVYKSLFWPWSTCLFQWHTTMWFFFQFLSLFYLTETTTPLSSSLELPSIFYLKM